MYYKNINCKVCGKNPKLKFDQTLVNCPDYKNENLDGYTVQGLFIKLKDAGWNILSATNDDINNYIYTCSDECTSKYINHLQEENQELSDQLYEAECYISMLRFP